MKKYLLIFIYFFFNAFNSNAQWTQIFQTPGQQVIREISALNDSVCWFITDMDSLYKTIDGGQTWAGSRGITISFVPRSLTILSKDTGFKSNSVDLYRTINGGTTWVRVFAGSITRPPIVQMKNSREGILTSNGLLYKTVDGGSTWNSSSVTQPPFPIIKSKTRGSIRLIGDTIMAALNGHGVAYSPDFGSTWNLPPNVIMTYSDSGQISFSKTFLGITFIPGLNTLYVTSDQINTWPPILNVPGSFQGVLAVNTKLWYIPNPTSGYYIYSSEDNGANWTTELFDSAGFYALEKSRDGNTIWAGTTHGTLYKNTSPLTSVSSTSQENNFSLVVSPNPFIDHTILSFKEYTTGTITITNVLGHQIKSIPFSGNQYVLQKDKLNSGTYILQVVNDKRQVLLKKIIVR